MVLAFNSKYDKTNNVQRDVILTKEKRSFRIRQRTNFRTTYEERHDEEERAYQAFAKIEEEAMG